MRVEHERLLLFISFIYTCLTDLTGEWVRWSRDTPDSIPNLILVTPCLPLFPYVRAGDVGWLDEAKLSLTTQLRCAAWVRVIEAPIAALRISIQSWVQQRLMEPCLRAGA